MDRMNITDAMLDVLRNKISGGADGKMSQKRITHTLEVEKMARRLGELYLPDSINMLCAAALLHDITKEYTFEAQLKICAEHNISVPVEEYYAPKTFHAKTAAALIPDLYPDFADGRIISAVRWHTTGHDGMTLSEKLIYLADYIDMSRKFDDCVKLRDFFWNAGPQNMDGEARDKHLSRTLILSYDMTMRGLVADNTPISLDTVRARNSLICELLK